MKKILKKQIFHKLDNELSSKNPKAAVLMVVADLLQLDELQSAANYFESKRNEIDSFATGD